VDAEDSDVTASCQAGPRVVALPEEIDIANALQVGEDLRAALRPGLAVLIADMTSTVFCDSAGLRQLLLATDAAAAVGAELRLVTESKAVLRVLQVTGTDRLLQTYPTLRAALAGPVPAVAEACPALALAWPTDPG
jgi:anti-sigma B factor antagonist